MKCLKPITLRNGLTVNCGSCRACRVNRSSSWTLRLLYELDRWDKAAFITLTYSDEYLPGDFSLHKDELQKFVKRLRARFLYVNRRVSYFACGEYGDDNRSSPIGIEHGRPHFHLIVFGVDPDDDDDRKIVADCWPYCDSFMFDKKRKDNGIELVNRKTIAYVCGYVQKKLTGNYAKELYEDRERPFMICSKGLGLQFFGKARDRISRLGFCYLNGKRLAIPRYFRQKFDIPLDVSAGFRKSKIFEETKILKSDFEEYCLKKNLIFSSLDERMRFFEFWYENRFMDLSRRIEKNFIDLKRIKGGKL